MDPELEERPSRATDLEVFPVKDLPCLGSVDGSVVQPSPSHFRGVLLLRLPEGDTLRIQELEDQGKLY